MDDSEKYKWKKTGDVIELGGQGVMTDGLHCTEFVMEAHNLCIDAMQTEHNTIVAELQDEIRWLKK